MAYQGGTKLISVRIDKHLYEMLEQSGTPKGTVVNKSLWALKHDWEFNRIKASEKNQLIDRYAMPVGSSYESVHTKMRIANMYLEWAHINQIVINRAINMAIDKYVHVESGSVVTKSLTSVVQLENQGDNVTTRPGNSDTDEVKLQHINDPVVTIYMNRAQLANIELRGYNLQKVIDVAAAAFCDAIEKGVVPIELLERLQGHKSDKYEPLTDTVPVNIRESRTLYTWANSIQGFRMSTFYYYAIKQLLHLDDVSKNTLADKYDLEP